MKMKRFLTLALALTILASLPLTAAALSVSDFTDVSAADWYYDAVRYGVDNGLTNGTSATTFNPQGTMTRAEFVTMLSRLNGTPELDAASSWNLNETTYNDVGRNAWWTPHINWAYHYGLIENGHEYVHKYYETDEYGNYDYSASKFTDAKYYPDSFRPSDPITREEMVEILGKYVELLGADQYLEASAEAPDAFRDADTISGAVLPYAEICREYGIVIGDNNGNLNPDSNMTRAEGITITMRVHQMLGKLESKIEFPQYVGTGIMIVNVHPQLNVGDTYQIEVIVWEPVGCTVRDITYSIVYEREAGTISVSDTGLVTCLKSGSATVQLMLPNGTYELCSVFVD